MNQLFESSQIGIVDNRPALSGPIDYRTCRHVDSWLSHAAPREIDLSQVTVLDSFGLRVLIDARIRDPGFRVVNPSQAVRAALRSSGTFEYLSVVTRSTETSEQP